ncbi:hypothetical protein Mal4_17270 [Maioricimonas rarisocia]|uniref:Uncharacterized protein n=1 Tax=Maioricimonas rarisocia TaxID=2528026 RepID=A0A517Z4P8_9PLAN|nr:hypothetical protein Mal4_17270 [Maioricimonas rarisocia]
MTRSILRTASFRGRYYTAALFYIGLSLVLMGTVTAPGTGLASPSESGCGPGETECQGNCIPEDYLCCDDGSYGPAENCGCCTECESCGGSSTYMCEE